MLSDRIDATVLVPKKFQSHIFFEDRQQAMTIRKKIPLYDNRNAKTTLERGTGFLIDIEIYDLSITTYSDVNSPKANENKNFRFTSGLEFVKKSYCRYPAPMFYSFRSSDYRINRKNTQCLKNTKEKASSPLNLLLSKMLLNNYGMDANTFENMNVFFGCYVQRKDPKFYMRFRIRHITGNLIGPWKKFEFHPEKNGSTSVLYGPIYISSNDLLIHRMPKYIFISAKKNASDFTGSLENQYEYEARILKPTNFTSNKAVAASIKFHPANPFLVTAHDWRTKNPCKIFAELKDKVALISFPDSPLAKNLKVQKIVNKDQEKLYSINDTANQVLSTIRVLLKSSNSVMEYMSKGSKLIDNGSFDIKLGSNLNSWVISLKGKFSECPGILRVRTLSEEMKILLADFDILVQCPKKAFEFSIKIPKSKSLWRRKLFVVFVSDLKYQYKYILEGEEMSSSMLIPKKHKRKFKPKKDPWKTVKPLIYVLGSIIISFMILMMYAQITSREDKVKQVTRSRTPGLVWVKYEDQYKTNEGEESQEQYQRKHFSQASQKHQYKKDRESCRFQNTTNDKHYFSGEGKTKQNKRSPEQSSTTKESNGKLTNKNLLLVVVAVAAKFAFSLVFTITAITAMLFLINDKNLRIIENYQRFVKERVRESKRIASSLDVFRESQAKMMIDKQAIMQCACDYHMGSTLQQIRDKMTATVQHNDLITFEKTSESITRVVVKDLENNQATKNVRSLNKRIKDKMDRFEKRVKGGIGKIKYKVNDYARKVNNNKWFKALKFIAGIFGGASMKILSAGGIFDAKLFNELDTKIKNQMRVMKNATKLSSIVQRLKKPSYPLTSALLGPVGKMTRKVKNSQAKRMKNLRGRMIKTKSQCMGDSNGNVNASKYMDSVNNLKNAQCKQAAAKKFAEKIYLKHSKAIKLLKKSKDNPKHLVKAANDDMYFDVKQGDHKEQEYDIQQQKRLKTLQKTSGYFLPSKSARSTFKYLKKRSWLFIIVIDIIWFIYRNIKTYLFAANLVHGFEKTEDVSKTSPNAAQKQKKPTLIRRLSDKFIGLVRKFFLRLSKVHQALFTTNIVPIVIIICLVAAVIYLSVTVAHNVLKVAVLKELGVFQLASASLDFDSKITMQALKEQAKYLNTHETRVYRSSVKRQMQNYQFMMAAFNKKEAMRLKNLQKELCAIDKDKGCKMNLQRQFRPVNVRVKPCAFPVINVKTPAHIYDSKAYQNKLQYEVTQYVDAVRSIVLNTLFFIIGLIGSIIAIIVASKSVFKFMRARNMVRIRKKYVYKEVPGDVQKEVDQATNTTKKLPLKK